MDALAELAARLDGSPYLVPDDDQGRAQVTALLESSERFEDRCVAVRQLIAQELSGSVLQASRTSEIYESNKIEGKTATLAETFRILDERKLFDAGRAIASYTLQRALDDEPKVQDVVGLNAARVLVDRFTGDRDRPLTETDLREMHAFVLVGTHGAGRYKEYLNEIEGAAHTPVAPADVPAAMNQLTNWFGSSPAPTLWKAAVAHAWLTHIHPFDDGNGRIARLLANYTLGFGAYPPLIIKASSDRGRYITALSHSDEAGDIVPLVRVFVRAINRQLAMMEKPGFVWQLFQKDLRIREQSPYRRWHETMAAFLREIESHLVMRHKQLDIMGDLSPSDFELLRRFDRSGNSWLAKVRGSSHRDLLVWIGHPSNKLLRHLEGDQVFPSFFLSERDANPKAVRPYLPRVQGLPDLHDEFSVIADESRALVRRGDRVTSLRLPEAAELWASLLDNYLDALARTD